MTGFAAFVRDKVRMLTCLILLASIAGFLAGAHWLLELTSHFRVQYLAVSVFSTAALVLFRDFRWSMAGWVAIGLNASVVFPSYFTPARAQTWDGEGERLRVLLSNVFTANTHSELVMAMVRSEYPDVVVLQEVDDRWVNELRELDPLLPHSKVISRSDNFGIGIWSRLPLLAVQTIESGTFAVPSIQAQVEVGGQKITILATHPVPPASRGGFAERNDQLVSLALLARRSSQPMIIVGDLNVTMWSPYYARLIRESGLKDARQGFGVLATWPTFLPFMMIPLDHCLVSAEIHANTFRTGRQVGSDHLPIIVDLTITSKK